MRVKGLNIFKKSSFDDVSDEDLMMQYCSGDMASFEALYQRHKGSFFRYFNRQLNDAVLAQDLYQELWGRIIKSAASYQASAKWTTWTYRIAHNLVIDYVRASKPMESYSEDPDQEDSSESSHLSQHSLNEKSEMFQRLNTPDSEHETLQLSEQLKHCIRRLPHAQQEVFLLSEETGMTVKAISEVISVSAEAAKSRLRYAKAQLQKCLSSFWSDYISGDSQGGAS